MWSFLIISHIYIPTGQLCLLSNGNSKERSIQGQRSRSNAWICKHFYLKSRLHVFPLLNGTIVVNFHHIWYIGAYRQGLFVFEQKFRMKVNLRSRSNPYFFFLKSELFPLLNVIIVVLYHHVRYLDACRQCLFAIGTYRQGLCAMQ